MKAQVAAAGGAAAAAAAPQQGGRVAAGLGPLVPVGSLTGLLKPLVAKGMVPFLEAIEDIAKAGLIPDVAVMAQTTLATAKDQLQFGKLKGDPLKVEPVAYVMKYTAEDSVPALYKDMNDKCYDKDRKKVLPYGRFIVGLTYSIKDIEAYPNTSVFRGVKADLRAHYPKGREVTWYGFCSTTKSIEVLSNSMFCGTTGKRTIFSIALTQGQVRTIPSLLLKLAQTKP